MGTETAGNTTGQGGAEAQEVDAVLTEFGGDARAAIAALLHDLKVMAEDRPKVVSFGYVRGRVQWQRRKT